MQYQATKKVYKVIGQGRSILFRYLHSKFYKSMIFLSHFICHAFSVTFFLSRFLFHVFFLLCFLCHAISVTLFLSRLFCHTFSVMLSLSCFFCHAFSIMLFLSLFFLNAVCHSLQKISSSCISMDVFFLVYSVENKPL